MEPLLAAYAATEPNDPRRASLRAALVAGYLPVARHIARRYAQRGEPLEDLEQIASLGLLNAIDRFDPERGHHFLAYAVPTITGEIRRHFRDRAWSMRVPRRLKDLQMAINSVVRELSQLLDRAPRPSEIAASLDMPTNEVLEALQASQAYQAISLDNMLSSETDITTGDRLGMHDPGFERFTDSHAVAPYLAALASREREILVMRFFDDMTQTQIADRIGISQMHVSRLLTQTLTQLRENIVRDTPIAVAVVPLATGQRSWTGPESIRTRIST